jgi:hypothetical protein
MTDADWRVVAEMAVHGGRIVWAHETTPHACDTCMRVVAALAEAYAAGQESKRLRVLPPRKPFIPPSVVTLTEAEIDAAIAADTSECGVARRAYQRLQDGAPSHRCHDEGYDAGCGCYAKGRSDAVAEEREACARVASDLCPHGTSIAAAIRARGEG